jgi:hypothetical protein
MANLEMGASGLRPGRLRNRSGTRLEDTPEEAASMRLRSGLVVIYAVAKRGGR